MTALKVTATQVAAAKLIVKRARARGLPVDDAVQAMADAWPVPGRPEQFIMGSPEGKHVRSG